MQSNGYTADENFWTDAVENFWTDEVEWVNDWRKYFWTDEQLRKWIFFEGMWSNSQTTEENYNIILITILHQAPLQLYKIERLDHFLIWYYVEIQCQE